MLVGSVANGLNSFGSFFIGLRVVVDQLGIDGTLFIFSALEGIDLLRNMPSILSMLRTTCGRSSLGCSRSTRTPRRSPTLTCVIL